jgi:hypothetical protein
MKRTYICVVFLLGLCAAMVVGCGCDVSKDTVAEGVILALEYKLEDGKTGGFTRLNVASAVPGGNGSWNVDAYGRLTRDYLFVTRPQQEDAGLRVIPAHRLVSVRFGDGGISSVDENKPNRP